MGAPIKGIMTNVPPTAMPEGTCPSIRGMYVKDGEIISDFGHTQFPAAGALKTNKLNGSVIRLDQYYTLGGLSWLIALTTTNMYTYNTSTETWDCRTLGTTVEDCEDAWVASANVTSVADGLLTGPIASVADYSGTVAGTVLITDVAHGLSTGHTVILTSTNTYDGTYDVTVVSADTYYITHAWGATSTGTWTTSYCKLKGTYAVKNTIAAAFTTGIASYENFSAANLSASVPYTDLACLEGLTTVTSATGGFTSNMAGKNLVIASGTNFTAATYRIMKINSGGSIEVDSCPVSGGNGTSGVATAARSALTHLHFWVYSSVALTAADYSIRLSEQNAGGAGATYIDFDIPAVAATTWTPCCVAESFANLNAVLSVALIVNSDKGAVKIHLDDIVAVKAFTGDEDNRFSTANMNDTFIITNGVDQPQKITESGGTLTVADLATVLATGTISTSEIVFAFKDHLFLINNTENAADCPQRVSWTNIGAIEDWIVGTAGYQDLVDDESWDVGVELMSENEFVIYKERSIVMGIWVGGHTPFRFYTMISGTGALAKECITSTGGGHAVLGPDVLYIYKGGKEIEIIDDNVKKTMYARLNQAYPERCFLMYVEEDDELQVWIPTDTAYPDDIWVMNLVGDFWYRKRRTMTGFGYYQEQSSLTIADLVGTIGEQNWKFGDMLTKAYAPITLVGDNNGNVYKLDKMTLDNNSVAITNEWETPDFIVPTGEDYINRFMRVPQLIYEAKGQSITTHWSSDSGATWSPTQGGAGHVVALTSNYELYQQDFDTTVRKIRFKFSNETAASGFYLRYYGFRWIPRSGRK